MEACCDVSASYDKWMSRLTISSWLTHVKDILNCGCLVAQCVEQVCGATFQLIRRQSYERLTNLHLQISENKSFLKSLSAISLVKFYPLALHFKSNDKQN